MKNYIVKSYEPEYGDEYFIITAPKMSDEMIQAYFEAAAKYVDLPYEIANAIFPKEELQNQYDEHFEQMFNYAKEGCNGQNMFEYYLTHICNFSVTPLKPDYEFTW